MSQHTTLTRRHFLKTSSIAGGGLVVGFSLMGCGDTSPALRSAEGTMAPNAFLQIGTDNTVTFYCPRDEMGQGASTGLATLIAEELDVAPWHFDVQWAGVHPDYNNPDFGVQGTGGSTSLKAHYEQLRQVGANTRAVIIEAAAGLLGVNANQLSTDDGHVISGSKRLPYGDFVNAAALLQAPEQAPLKPAHGFKYIGRDFSRIDAMEKATGTAEFGIDVDIENLHHAVVKRCPVAGGTVASYDATAALAVAGVSDVVEIGSGIAVVAQKYWAAKKGLQALEVQWQMPKLAAISTADIKRDYQAALGVADDQALIGSEAGDLEQGFAEADHVVEGEYWAPYLAHAPMEPMNAIVRIENGEADVWTGSQGVGAPQGLVARYAGLAKENVRSHNTYLGGAFGRRGTLTHVIEATQVAVATGKPIQVLWSREDDLQSGVYRPASLMQVKAGVTDEGKITAWQATRVGGNISPETMANMMPALLPTAVGDGTIDWVVGLADSAFKGWVVDGSSVEGLAEDYDTGSHQVRHTTIDHGLPLTFWRSVGHSYTAFAKETAIDELAAQADIDPVAFRLKNLTQNPRLQNVVRLAGEHMQQMQVAPGRALGFAAHHSFATDVAEIAEVSVSDGKIHVHRVVCVVDCGIAVNPDVVRAQMEGAVMYGLTAALHGNLELEKGQVVESNFHNYPILRMDEAPEVEVIIADSGTSPTGVGEPGLPPIAPAVANAVFAATGQRLRSLPLQLA